MDFKIGDKVECIFSELENDPNFYHIGDIATILNIDQDLGGTFIYIKWETGSLAGQESGGYFPTRFKKIETSSYRRTTSEDRCLLCGSTGYLGFNNFKCDNKSCPNG